MKRVKRIAYIEFWLRHKQDASKDIHFYVSWNSHDHISEAFSLLRQAQDDEYAQCALIRHIDRATTRKEKCIDRYFRSQVKHISKFK